MTAALADFLSLTQQQLSLGFLVFLRVGAAMAVLPAFGEQSVPVRVRLALALCFTAIVAPAVSQTAPDLAQAPLTVGLQEVAAGLILGLGLRIFVMALQIAGSIAAQATSLSQIFGAAAADPQPAIGHLLLIGGLAIAVTAGLHVRAAELFIVSYEVFPGTEGFPAPEISQWGIAQVSRAFGLAFQLAAPFVLASLIYNVALGVINRAMPQLMVAFVGAPAITAGGLVLMFLTLPIIFTVWVNAFNAYLVDPFGATP